MNLITKPRFPHEADRRRALESMGGTLREHGFLAIGIMHGDIGKMTVYERIGRKLVPRPDLVPHGFEVHSSVLFDDIVLSEPRDSLADRVIKPGDKRFDAASAAFDNFDPHTDPIVSRMTGKYPF